MRISPINYYGKTNFFALNRENKQNHCTVPILNNYNADTVCFRGVVGGGGKELKALTKYGMTDFLTGKDLIDPKYLEHLLNKKIFYKPLKKVVPILQKLEGCFWDSDVEFLRMLEGITAKSPDIDISQALQMLKPEHEKKLVQVQKPKIFELVRIACKMPEKYFNQFMDLMIHVNERIDSKEVQIPFSARELIYKMNRVKAEIKARNNPKELSAINNLIRSANTLFGNPLATVKKSKERLTRAEKLKVTLRPEFIEENSKKIEALSLLFENSVIKNHKKLRMIIKDAHDKIHGTLIKAPFKNKDFEYDLETITNKLSDRKLASELLNKARELPSSKDNVSAFIVKCADDSPSTIGFYLLKDYRHSVDHLLAKAKGGKNKIDNYGLCSILANMLKTDNSFADWCREYPDTYQHCQKYVDRLIEHYQNGILKKAGVPKQYIYDFTDAVHALSPKEKPMVLDLSALKD